MGTLEGRPCGADSVNGAAALRARDLSRAYGSGLIEVLLVGDVALHLEGIAVLLARDERLHVGPPATPADPLDRAADVVVVDTPGPEVLESLRLAARDGASIVLLGVPDDEFDAIAFAESGVLGFVEHSASLDDLVTCIVTVAHGQASFPPRIATALLRRVASLASRRALPDAASLTGRERQIVQLIAKGLSNKEIAARLCIEVATVKNHVHNILEKLQVRRRADAVTRLRVVEGMGGSPQPEVSATRSTAR